MTAWHVQYVRHRRDHRHGDDEGQLLLLVLGFVVVAALLVTAVVNASRVFLHERALAAAAGGAAIAATSALDEGAVYGSRTSVTLPLTQDGVMHRVEQYVTESDLPERFHGFRITMAGLGADGEVTVRFAATVELPFVNLVSERYRNGYPIEVTARARAPFR